jgi:hypothetical protein
MRRTVLVPLLALGALLSLVSQLPAGPIGPPPIQDQMADLRNQVSAADVVVVGKVKAIEDRRVVTATYPTELYHAEHKVAVIAVDEVIVGPKELREVRVAFKAVYSSQPLARNLELIVGEEGCYLLKRHHDMDFYVWTLREKKDHPNYQRDVVQVRQAGRCLRDMLAGLKSKEPEDRLVAASMLIQRYRGQHLVTAGQPFKQVPIDAEESKLILLALADAEWKVDSNSVLPSAPQLFARLGVTRNDGLAGKQGVPFQETAKAWLRENAETYRIQRIVPDEAKK